MFTCTCIQIIVHNMYVFTCNDLLKVMYFVAPCKVCGITVVCTDHTHAIHMPL